MNNVNEKSSIDFQELDNSGGETELAPPELFAAHLIEWCLERSASDLFVSDVDGAVMVAVRRLGRIEAVRRLARQYGHRLQGHLRVLAGADAGDTVHPVEGRGTITTPDGSKAQLRLSTIPTFFGQDVAIRLFDPERGARTINDLGMDACEVSTLEELVNRQSGLVLVTGPVASGKTCTLYAMLDHLNDGSRKIHTIEDPIEHSLTGTMQTAVNRKLGLDFADLLTAVLRHSPDVIMLGEVRDQGTARTAVRAGASGQLVLATVHSKNAAEAVDMMLQYESNPKFFSRALIGVINQRLVPRLCQQCRVAGAEVDQKAIPQRVRDRLAGAEPKLYASKGCPACNECGYDGLVAMPEVMSITESVEQAMAEHAPATELEAEAIRSGMLPLREVAMSYVLRGITTIEEATRVVDAPAIAELRASHSTS